MEGICAAAWTLTDPNGTLSYGSNASSFQFTPGLRGVWTVEALVTDNEGDTDSTSIPVEVQAPEPEGGSCSSDSGQDDGAPDFYMSIDPGSGNHHFRSDDPVSTRGYPLTCNLHINSQTYFPAHTTAMGNARFTYGIEVHIGTYDGSAHYFVLDADGTELNFGPTSASPTASDRVFSSLQLITGGYELSGAGAPENLDRAGNYTYEFNSSGKLTKLTDPNGNIQEISYDGNGDIDEVEDLSSGRVITFEYDTPGSIARIVEAGGDAVTHLGYDSGKVDSIVLKDSIGTTIRSADISYNTNGLISQLVKDNDATSAINITYTYAGNGVYLANFVGYGGHASNINYLVSPTAGAIYSVKHLNAQGGYITYDYNADGQVTKAKYPTFNGATSGPTYTFTYNTEKLLSSVSNGATTISYTYNSLGEVLTRNVTGAQSQTFTYSGADLLTAADQDGTYTTLVYGDTNNPHAPTSYEDDGGNTWTYTYNTYGQPLTVVPPSGSPTGATTYAYEETSSDPDYGYLRSITDALSNVTTFDSYTDFGDVASVSTSPSTGVTNTTLFSYDPARRLTEIEHPDGKTISISYDGHFLDTVLDESSNQTSYVWDKSSERLVEIDYELSKSLEFARNTDLSLTGFTDALTKQTVYTYGNAGELKKEAYPDGHYREYFYDNYGRLEERKDSSTRRVIVNGYDTAGRVTSLAFSNNWQPGNTFSYEKDGRYKQVTDEAAVTNYSYDSARRLSQISYNFSTSGLSRIQLVDYTYNPDGTVDSMTWKDNGTTVVTWDYAYDAAGRLTEVDTSFGDTVEYSYDGEGKIDTQTNSNGTTTEYTYNENRNWVTDIVHKAGLTTFESFALEYDGTSNTVGNLTKVTELSTDTVTYAYDDLYRLTSEVRTGSNSYTKTYGYDLAGNLTTLNGSTFATYDNGNKLATIPGGTPGHNGIGDINAISGTGLTTASYTWGTRSETRSETVGGSQTTFKYDAFLRRSYKEPPGGSSNKRWYVFAGGVVIGEVTTSGAWKAYTWGADGLAFQNDVSSGNVRFHHYGPQGETRALTNDAGTVSDTFRFDAYGNELASTGTSFVPHRYGGKFGYYTDEGSTIILATHRWYSPQIRRWLQRDPIDYEGGDNLYEYVGSNPITFIDPSGFASVETDMTNGHTTFDPRPEEEGPAYRVDSSNDAKCKQPGCKDPFETEDVRRLFLKPTRAYGPSGAYIDTFDPRGRDLHGGGSCINIKDPFAPYQGWCKTFGCTRIQNEDIDRLARDIENFKKRNPKVKIPYRRK